MAPNLDICAAAPHLGALRDALAFARATHGRLLRRLAGAQRRAVRAGAADVRRRSASHATHARQQRGRGGEQHDGAAEEARLKEARDVARSSTTSLRRRLTPKCCPKVGQLTNIRLLFCHVTLLLGRYIYEEKSPLQSSKSSWCSRLSRILHTDEVLSSILNEDILDLQRLQPRHPARPGLRRAQRRCSAQPGAAGSLRGDAENRVKALCTHSCCRGPAALFCQLTNQIPKCA